MSDSTGIVLAATGISLANKWYTTEQFDLAIPLAGGLVALLFNGIERVDHTAGVGMATLMMISVLLTPPKGGTAPADTVLSWLGQSPNQPKKKGK